MPKPATSARRARIMSALLVLAGSLAGLGLAETAIRGLSHFRHVASLRLFTLDPFYGRINVPNSSGWSFIVGVSERNVRVRYNSLGLRGPQVPPRSPGTLRIAAMGDSVTEGWSLEESDSYPAQLQERLNSGLPRPRYLVINAGVSGWGNDNALLFLRHHGRELDPDLVTVTLNLSNDLIDNSYPLRRFSGTEAARWQPYFELDGPGLALRNYPAPVDEYLPGRLKRWLGAHSYLWCFTSDTVRSRAPQLEALLRRTGLVMRKSQATSEGAYPLRYKFMAPDLPKDLEDSWRITERLMRELQAESRKLGARLVIIVLPLSEELLYQDTRDFLAHQPAIRDAGPGWDLHRLRTRALAMARANGIYCLDLYPALKGHAQEIYLKQDHHFTRRGNELTAAALQSFLAEKGLLKK